MTRWCRSPGLVGLAVVSLGGLAHAQSGIPSAHWGADLFPAYEPELRGTLSLDRFTQFDSDGNQYNEIEETSGFNIGTVSYTDYLRLSDCIPASFATYTLHLGVGYSADQPTRFLQNNYLHGVRNLDFVPVGETRRSTELLAGLESNLWFDVPFFGDDDNQLDDRLFLGAGFVTSTLYQEPFTQVGVSIPLRLSRNYEFQIRGVERVSWPIGGDAYPDVAPWSSLTQATIAWVPRSVETNWSVLRFMGNPEIGVTITHDTGLFVDARDQPIATRLIGLYLEWATGLRLETYNDMRNNTDFGPSYGFQISVDLMTFYDDFLRDLSGGDGSCVCDSSFLSC